MRLLAYTLLLLCLPAAATTVYKSVDEQGRVIFSDTPPLDTSLVDILEIEAPAPQPSAADTARLAALREVTERMSNDRLLREAERAARRQQTGNQQRPQLVEVYQPRREYYYHRPVQQHAIRHYQARSPAPMRSRQYPASQVRRYYSDVVRRVFER